MDQESWPAGVAYVEQLGWEEDEEHGRRFMARLVYPSGPPTGFKVNIVFNRKPVKLVLNDAVAERDDELTSGLHLQPSDTAVTLAAIIRRRIKKGLEAEGIPVEPKFTGLSQLIEVYLEIAREEVRSGERT